LTLKGVFQVRKMAKYQLSKGTLLKICQGAQDVEYPIFQLLQTKKIAGTSTERYRMLMSDGANSNSYGMLATQLNGLIHEEKLKEHCIFKVNKFQVNNMQGKKVIIVLDLEVLQDGTEVGEKIGSPVAINADGTIPTQSVDQNRAPNVPNNGDHKRVARNEAAGSPATKRPSILDRPPIGHGIQANLAGQPIYPIASLTPYQNKWTIKARVTNKSDIRRWSNSRGEGHLFSMDLLDESGEIRATAFKNECDKFEPMVEVNKVYYISNCKLKTANKQFSTLNNDYELTFNEMSEMVPCTDQDTANIPRVTFNFAQLSQLTPDHKDNIVDVIGICRSASEAINFTSSKTGKELTKRDITLADQSMVEIKFTVWGGTAESFNPSGNPVVAVKGCKVSDFNGVSLSALNSSTIQINPDLPQCHELKGWYEQDGYKAAFQSKSQDFMGGGDILAGAGAGANILTVGEVKSSQIGLNSERGEYYSTTATIVMFQKEKALYQACTQSGPEGRGCNKKVQDQGNGTYRCEKCNMDMDSFNWRLILSFSIADATDNQWINCFQEVGEAILQTSSQELGTMQQMDPEGYNRVFQEATFKKFNFRLRAKADNYNDEQRIRHTIMSAEKVNLDTYNKMMIKELRENGIDLPKGMDESKYS